MTRKTISDDKDGNKSSKVEARDYMKLKKLLEEFVDGNCKVYNEDMDYVIHDVALSGVVRMPWKLLKPLLKYKIDKVLTESFQDTPVKDDPPVNEVMELLDKFNGPPFTIQRICELIKDPCRVYKRRDKYIRALQKNFLVVTTLEPDLIWMKVPNLSALLDPKSSPTIPLPTPPSPSSITDKDIVLSRDLPSPTWKFQRSPISPRSPRSPRSRTPPPDFDSFTGRNWEGLLEPHPILFRKRAGSGSSILKDTPLPPHSTTGTTVEPLVQLQEADSTVPDQQLPVSSTLEEEQSTSRGVKRSRSNSEEEVGILKNILSSSEILLKAKSDLGGAKEDPNSSSINEQSTTTVGDSHEEPDKTSPTTDIQGDGESVSSNENKDISTDDSESSSSEMETNK